MSRGHLSLVVDKPSRSSVAHAAVSSTVLAAVCYALPVYFYYVRPVAYVYLVTEDSYGEWATFFAWLFAFGVAAFAIWRREALRLPGFVLFALACFFIAGEEIDWGQRVLYFAVPSPLAALNTQGEPNFHNLALSRGYRYVNYAIAAWAVVPLLTLPMRRSVAPAASFGIPFVPLYVLPMFLVALVYLTAHAVPMLWVSGVPLGLSKIGELYLGLAALLVAMQLFHAGKSVTRPRTAPRVWTHAGAVAAVVVCGIAATLLCGNELTLASRLNHFAAAVYPNQGQSVQGLMLFDYIEAHPQYVDPGIDRWSRGPTRVRHARLLLRSGHVEDAQSVLGAALAEQDMQLRALAEQQSRMATGERVGPLRDEAAIERNRGSILRSLDEDDAAGKAFAKSLAIDEERLASGDAEVQASTHFSLARTRLAMGDGDAAHYEAAVAMELTADRAFGTLVEGWITQELDGAY